MSTNPEARILLVDDAVRLRSRLEDFFESHNFVFKSLDSGLGVKQALADFMPDLMLLDIMMPGADGFEILRSVRETSSIPVIMLTACNNRGDRVRGLDQGADDYLGKPFHLGELLARIRAVLRRSHLVKEALSGASGEALENVVCGPLTLDIGQRRLTSFFEERVKKKNLTNLEFRIFHFFMSRAGQILTRDEIMNHLFENRIDEGGQSLRVYINRIRKILAELDLDPRTVATVWGSGYRFNPTRSCG
ncbi:MAG: response regulator transcription factor [Deltaproteobacteria bacterium]|jgi:DNA-binding response OmpR family regulator|nr:response regulator transcription factor [Deltaproteobacteria bacterium]